jgi:concanavalin A-like lectin/glucanase superfamily protein
MHRAPRSLTACTLLAAIGLLACTGTPSATEGAQASVSSSSAGGAGGHGGGSGGAGASGGSEGGSPPLLDDELVARYFIDEAASGQTPTTLADAAPDPLPLALSYVPQMTFTEKDGHRGLQFTATELDGRASVLADATKIQDRLAGSLVATIEAVFELEDVSTNGSRIVHIGFDTEWFFSLGSSAPNRLRVFISGTEIGRFVTPLPTLGRVVVHAVIDNTQADPEARCRLYVDGSPVLRIAGTPMDQNEAFTLPNGKHFVLGNREIGLRTFQGILYYAALYQTAFTEEQVADNTRALLQYDDTP